MLMRLDDFDAAAEQHLLLAELAQVRADWNVGARIVENILGLTAGFLDANIAPPLPACAEAQLRRLLEVARLTNVLMGDGTRGWLMAAEARLGFARPLDRMQRPGGLGRVRDLLQDAWDENEQLGWKGC